MRRPLRVHGGDSSGKHAAQRIAPRIVRMQLDEAGGDDPPSEAPQAITRFGLADVRREESSSAIGP